MNKYQEALNRVKTIMSDVNNVYKSYTDSYTVFFEDINTLEELVDKVTPKKPIKIKTDCMEVYYCPNCGHTFEYSCYCGFCGQRLYR